MNIDDGNHCKYQIRYHIVWKIKYSRKLIFGERRKFLRDLIHEIAKKYEFTVEAVGFDETHVHVFVGAHPAISPAKLVQIIKSITAREMFREYPDIKKFLWGGSFWAIGYYVRTVSDGPLEHVIKKYVEEQNQKVKSTRRRSYQLKLVP